MKIPLYIFSYKLSHASDYSQAGAGWYTNFVQAELAETEAHSSVNDPLNPYGPSTSSNAPIIALGEAWGYFMGHFLADQEYGDHSSYQHEQGQWYYNNSPVSGLSSHLNLLEDFSPTRTNDPFHWIPQGLFYDLMDDRNDFNAIPQRVPLVDNVSRYTNQKFFNALDTDINNLEEYRQRFLQENGNDQATGVNSIFNFYRY